MSIEYVNPSGLKHHGEKVLSEAKTYTDEKIDAIVGEGASETLDTIGEISKAIEDNEDVVEALNSAIGNKVDKVDGKGLSANDLTDTLKSNYDTAYSHSQSSHAPSTAEKNVIVGIQRNGTDLSVDSSTRKVNVTVPTKTSELTNDSGFKTTDNNTTYELSKSGSTITLTGSDGSTTSVSDSNTTYSVATSSANGLMSSTDKAKLDTITESADAVSFTQSLTSGTKVGTININGTNTALYAPTNTDTHYTSKNVVGSTSATSNTTTALTNGNVYLNSVENGSVTSTHKISGSGATTVTTDTSGNIVITSTDNNTVTTATTTGSGNAVTAITASNGALTVTKGSTFLTAHPTISTSTDTTSTATATHGGTVTMVDSVTRDDNGHVTKINTKTVTLPSDADTKYTHPTTSGNKHIPSGGSSGQILRWSADGTAVWGADNNTTYGVVSTTADGLAPKRDGSTTKYLRADGTWATPPDNNTTYNNMTAATSSAAGKAGLVPAPAAGAQAKFLRGDGTWQTPTNTTYSNFVKSGSGAKAGLVPAPSTTAGTTKYLREDGTWTTPPDTNTTYSVATTSANGLMSSTDKSKLNGIATGANAYTLPTASSSTLGGVKTTSTVTSTSGLTASPIIDGVPYYDKRTSVSSPLPNSTTFGTYYPVLCPSVATNVSSLSVDTGIKFGSRSGSLTLDGSNTTTSDSSFVSLTVKMPKSGQYSSTGISITPAGTSAYHTGMSINCGTSTGPGMRGLIISCTANTHQPTLEIDRTGGTNSYAISCQKGRSYIADIYSNAAINTTSDREKKMDIKDITSDYEELFFKLQPRLFKYKDGNSGRIHIGAIAQEVEEALDAVGIDDSNFAGFVRQEKDYKVNEETGEVTQEEGYDYYLRYEEFIMLLCHMLQKLYSEKEEQDNKISDLEERLASLESKLA